MSLMLQFLIFLASMVPFGIPLDMEDMPTIAVEPNRLIRIVEYPEHNIKEAYDSGKLPHVDGRYRYPVGDFITGITLFSGVQPEISYSELSKAPLLVMNYGPALAYEVPVSRERADEISGVIQSGGLEGGLVDIVGYMHDGIFVVESMDLWD